MSVLVKITYISCSFGTSVCANLPKPVLTPYTTTVKKQYIQLNYLKWSLYVSILRLKKRNLIPLSSLIDVSIISLAFMTFSSASGLNWMETKQQTSAFCLHHFPKNRYIFPTLILNKPWPKLTRSAVVRLLPSRRMYWQKKNKGK